MPKPPFIYGTAWKKDATTGLVKNALAAGFTAIDTANQLKHYDEAAVGEALVGVLRGSVYLQTKYTSIRGQDERLPYDPSARLAQQVTQSFESSLEHLRTDYLDSYLVHGPIGAPVWGYEDEEVWTAFEEIYRSGKTRSIGVSNVNAMQLRRLMDKAEIKPMIVQNRCFANRGWDREIRELCREHGITYQGFSLLTANPEVVRGPLLARIRERTGATSAQIVFAFSRTAGIMPLTGTTDIQHMREDLAAADVVLTSQEVQQLENVYLEI